MPEGQNLKHWVPKFRAYRDGERKPSYAMIARVAEDFPWTKRNARHPFWRIARTPCVSQRRLRHHLAQLRPGVRRILFGRGSGNLSSSPRSDSQIKCQFKALAKEGDLDALSACLALIHELKHQNRTHLARAYTQPTYAVFLRCFIEHLRVEVSVDWFAFLFEYFLDNPVGKEIYSSLNADVIPTIAQISLGQLHVILDLHVIDIKTPAIACLHIAEEYLDASVMCGAEPLNYRLQDRASFKSRPIEELRRALEEWQRDNYARFSVDY